jgi:hypothetical protein
MSSTPSSVKMWEEDTFIPSYQVGKPDKNPMFLEKRVNDKAGLGDWYVNKEKFPEGLMNLIRRLNELGMDFGIWVELAPT